MGYKRVETCITDCSYKFSSDFIIKRFPRISREIQNLFPFSREGLNLSEVSLEMRSFWNSKGSLINF